MRPTPQQELLLLQLLASPVYRQGLLPAHLKIISKCYKLFWTDGGHLDGCCRGGASIVRFMSTASCGAWRKWVASCSGLPQSLVLRVKLIVC